VVKSHHCAYAQRCALIQQWPSNSVVDVAQADVDVAVDAVWVLVSLAPPVVSLAAAKAARAARWAALPRAERGTMVPRVT
jgi:hypothetical protein